MTANSDLIIYQENELYGLKDCNGNIIISPQYKEMYPFSCGLALVKNNKSQLGYINKENKLIVPFDFILGVTHNSFVDLRGLYVIIQ